MCRDVSIAHFNDDNHFDIVLLVSSITSDNIGVLIDYDNGTFTYPITFSSHSLAHSMTIIDLNKDDEQDIPNSNSIEILYGFDNGSFACPITYFSGYILI